jgi:hypothetical protein
MPVNQLDLRTALIAGRQFHLDAGPSFAISFRHSHAHAGLVSSPQQATPSFSYECWT